MRRFEGKAVLVTGAGSGIGAACVRRLYSEGATVIAVDATDVGVGRLVSELDDPDRIKSVVLDVRDRDAAIAVVADAHKRSGALDGLINCAGIKGVGNIVDVEPENFQQVMAVNLEGTINMCHAYVQAVKEDKYARAIVNISSGAGILGVANRLPYVASKFGVTGITKSMSPELGPLGIRVNAVAPGMTKTPFTEYMLQDPAAVERVKAAHPIGRMGEPEEIAAVIVFLLTDDASFMTGAIVSVDGGQTACL
jgi:meso-butanediol dehydrogenase / (S,S)-butanediol dehydrogenase / diacetyl reductase